MDKSVINADLAEYLDNRFVRKDNCSERQLKTEKEISEILITQSAIMTKLEFITKIGLAIVTATVGLLVAHIGGVLFK